MAMINYGVDTMGVIMCSLIDEVIKDIPKVGIEVSEEYADELKYVCDSRVILDNLRDFEVKIPKEFIEKSEHTFDVAIQYMELLTGATNNKFGGENTYNWNGRIMHDFNCMTYEMKDHTYYVAIMVHRGGDIRENYTDYVLFKFDTPEEYFEVISNITLENCGGVEEINGRHYYYDLSIFTEYIHVWCEETEEEFDIYAYNDESFKEEILKFESENTN